ncbi:MAG: LutB/LldF family L-lactate oxidation iron-sulfur protein [Gammaproteobacteria bacterium]|nr:LutB/LldF family L-lactate oxidation iron-sulfur protein [Gammaproteobacteria bacterium]
MKAAASHLFKQRVPAALADADLQAAMGKAQDGFVGKREQAVSDYGDFDALRDVGQEIKDHTLAHLDYYLERYEAEVQRSGGHVHWARNSEEARRIILDICERVDAKNVTKGKSMVSEEIGLNDALEESGIAVHETDLGEYIIQIARETPSHIIAPAVHKTKDQISDLFHANHGRYGFHQRLTEVPALVNEARQILRQRYLEADVGITGANFLIAENGANLLVTNEGNGDLTCTMSRVHIVTAGIEKLVPTLEDATAMVRLLTRSATGQEFSAYTTLSSGPRRDGDQDGPEEYHVVLVDNVRTEMLGSEFRSMLRCIRCGACMNHCPVYGAVGGHVYGWVYPGPMGSVLTPLNIGLEQAGDLPNACTLNGRCGSVCPVNIPLPDLLRRLRRRQHEAGLDSRYSRAGLKLWSALATRPAVYRVLTRCGVAVMRMLARGRGRLGSLPLAGGWTDSRDMPAPAGRTFHSLYRQRGRR